MKITITDNIWDYSVEDYMFEFGITHTDLTNIKSFAPVAQANLDEVISEFYNHLRHYENFTDFFPQRGQNRRGFGYAKRILACIL